MLAMSQGQVNFTMDNVCQGIKPNKMVIGFVESKSAAGDFTKSPWNFQGFSLSELIVAVDGIPVLGNPVRVHFNPTGNSNTGKLTTG